MRRNAVTRVHVTHRHEIASAMAQFKFIAFCLIVLMPGSLMLAGDPQLIDLGKLTLIVSPALAALVLNVGLGNRGERV